MQPGLSLYLDAVRFTAALVVALGHLGTLRISGGFLWQLRAYGSPCVAIFFVLSGFVIAYVSQRPGMNGRDYARDRVARIMSVALPAIVLTLVLDAAGQAVAPGLYAETDPPAPIALQVFSAAVFLNESWFGHIQLGSNGAYWSMGYEVWYYVAFGLAMFLPPRWRWAAAALALAVAGPRVAAYFPLWLIGVACFWATRNVPLPQSAGLALWLGTWVAAALFLAWTGAATLGGTIFIRPPGEFWKDYLVGAWFAANLLGAAAIAPLLFHALHKLRRPIEAAAGITFTLYLVHLPLLMAIRAFAPWPSAAWQTRALLISGVAAGVWLVAQVTERRRTFWRAAATRLLLLWKAQVDPARRGGARL